MNQHVKPMTLIKETDYGTPTPKLTDATNMVTLEIDGREVTVPEGTSIMNAAMQLGIQIPKLCATDSLDPEENRNYEAGAHWDVRGMQLRGALFRTEKTNARTDIDPGTGKVIPQGLKHVTPSKEDLTGGQKFAAAMTGQTSLPKGRQFFVIELPQGEWVLYSVSGFYSDGLAHSYSSTSFFSKGTVAFQSTSGVARYLGEYRVVGNFGEAMDLQILGDDLGAAQEAFKKYPRIELPLQASKPSRATFSCETMKNFMNGQELCKWKTVMVQVAAAPAS